MKTITLKKSGGRGARLAKGLKSSRSQNGNATASLHSLVRVKSILVPVDFSIPSQRAVQYALPLLKQFGATLTLIHVVEPSPLPAFAAPFPTPIVDDKVMETYRSQLEAIIKQNGLDAWKAKVQVCRGRAFEEISNMARRLKTDLIVMSTHGYRGLKHVFLGSTAERVIRHAPCPVLVVPRQPDLVAGQSAQLKLQKILVPLDFSECSLYALKHSVRLAKEFNASQSLIYVVHPTYYFSDPDFDTVHYARLVEDIRRGAVHQMNELLKTRHLAGLKVTSRVCTGHPVTQILNAARRQDVDLIVISTHGLTGLKHVLLGSVAENIIRQARCPVLVVRPAERDTAWKN